MSLSSIRARSSSGRALPWHGRGKGFEPPRVHRHSKKTARSFLIRVCATRGDSKTAAGYPLSRVGREGRAASFPSDGEEKLVAKSLLPHFQKSARMRDFCYVDSKHANCFACVGTRRGFPCLASKPNGKSAGCEIIRRRLNNFVAESHGLLRSARKDTQKRPQGLF